MSEEQVAEVSQEVAPSVAVSDDWRSVLDEDIRDHKSLNTIKSVAQLGKSYINAQSMIGADKMAIPGKYATEDDWREVDQKLGMPETPDAYELVNNIPDGVEASDDMLGWFRQTAHDVGLRPGQAQKLLDAYNDMSGSQEQTDTGNVDQLRADAELELKREYGAAYEDRMGNGQAVLHQFGNADLANVQLADGRVLGDHPEMVKLMVNVGQFMSEKISEDSLEGVKTSMQMTPSDIQSQINEIRGEYMQTPYWQQRAPGHDHAVKEVNRLTEMLLASGQ